jgi:signal transduction histidine kinase
MTWGRLIPSLFDRFWAFAGAFNVRTKILGIVLGLVLLFGVVITLQIRMALAKTLTTQLQEQSISVSRDLAARATDLILLNDLYGLHRLLQETQANNANVLYAFALDPQGRVLAHTFGDQFPLALIAQNSALPSDHHKTVILQTNDGLVWDTVVPVLEGRAGMARVGLSDATVREAVRDVTGQLILTTILVSLVGITAATFLTWILTRPILELVQATEAIASSDFSYRVKRWADDEIGELAQAFNQMTEELSRINVLRRERELLRRQLLEKVIETQEEERKRIARELHDSTSQTLTSLLVGLRVLESTCPDIQIQKQAQDLREVAAQTLEEVHGLAMQLRPRLLDDLGLAAALERLIKEWQSRYQIPVDSFIHLGKDGNTVETHSDHRLPGAVETAVFRIVQEALTNIARHAQASAVSVLVERRDNEVVAVIEDNGIGFSTEETHSHSDARAAKDPHLGILGIRERAELLGGRLTIESNPGVGTTVFVGIPVLEDSEITLAEWEAAA